MGGWAFSHERGNPLQASGARTKCVDFSNMNAVLEIRNSKPIRQDKTPQHCNIKDEPKNYNHKTYTLKHCTTSPE